MYLTFNLHCKLTFMNNVLVDFVSCLLQPHCFHRFIICGLKRICLSSVFFIVLLWKHFIGNGSWVIPTDVTQICVAYEKTLFFTLPLLCSTSLSCYHCTLPELQHFASCNFRDRDDTSALNAHLQTSSSLRTTQVFCTLLDPESLDNTALTQPCYLDCHSNSFSPQGPISQTLCQ